MDALRQQIGERAVHQALTRDARLAGKSGRSDDHAKMALARAVIAQMAAMHRTFVDDFQMGGGQRLGQTGGDLIGDSKAGGAVVISVMAPI